MDIKAIFRKVARAQDEFFNNVENVVKKHPKASSAALITGVVIGILASALVTGGLSGLAAALSQGAVGVLHTGHGVLTHPGPSFMGMGVADSVTLLLAALIITALTYDIFKRIREERLKGDLSIELVDLTANSHAAKS